MLEKVIKVAKSRHESDVIQRKEYQPEKSLEIY